MPTDTNFRPGSHLCASFQKEGKIAVDTCQVGHDIEKRLQQLRGVTYAAFWTFKTRRDFDRKFAILFEVEKKTNGGGVYKIDLGLILHRYVGQFGIDFRAIHTGY